MTTYEVEHKLATLLSILPVARCLLEQLLLLRPRFQDFILFLKAAFESIFVVFCFGAWFQQSNDISTYHSSYHKAQRSLFPEKMFVLMSS